MDRARDEIAAAGGDVVSVFMYRAGPTRNFCRKRGVELDCYGDPERKLYDAVGLERGGARELYSPRVALGTLRAASRGAIVGDPQGGDTRQMPGTFVIGTNGRLVFAHYNRDQSDNPSTQAVIAAVRGAAPRR